MIKLLVFFLLIIQLVFPKLLKASENNQFITLVNPVRVSIYSSDPLESLKNQSDLITQNNLPASWLLTYDALNFLGLVEVVKTMDGNQDVGVFLEVTESMAKDAGVTYNKTDSWHRANSVFLSGYSQEDRIKLIDYLFENFKNKLGFYPTSIGAWWVDSFSLDYMQKKYGVNANLVVADQLGTDGYSIWGQPWAIPYYPSKNHSAIPASTLENKLDIVNMQWAPRDPLNGYKSPDNKRSSLYSTQDYYTIGLGDVYFEDLIKLYAGKHKNEFGQITFGLEGDLGPEVYLKGSQFDRYIQTAVKFANSGNFTVTNMKQFSNWYQQKYPRLPGGYLIESENLTKNTKNKSFWYQNSNYRLGLVFDEQEKKLKFIDLRIYQKNFREPFYTLKNGQIDLVINNPSIIDTVIDPRRNFELNNIDYVQTENINESFRVNVNNGVIELREDEIKIKNLNSELPNFIKTNALLSYKKTETETSLIFNRIFPVEKSGFVFQDLKIETTYFLKTGKAKLAKMILLLLLVICLFSFFKLKKNKKSIPLIFFLSITTLISIWYYINLEEYYVTQSEVEALVKLRTYEGKSVLVLNRDCLQCESSIQKKAAIFANKRNYVSKLSNKKLIYDNELIESNGKDFGFKTKLKREDVKNYLMNSGADYIYITKHESYSENLPYSPGDLGVEQVYINSDAQIWRIKK